jgi:hypothetical protein
MLWQAIRHRGQGTGCGLVGELRGFPEFSGGFGGLRHDLSGKSGGSHGESGGTGHLQEAAAIETLPGRTGVVHIGPFAAC